MQRKRKPVTAKKQNRSKLKAKKRPAAKQFADSGFAVSAVLALCEIVGIITWWGLQKAIRRPFSALLLAGLFLITWIWFTLPDVNWLVRIDRGTEFYVKKQGRELSVLDAVTNLQISLENIPDHLEQAVIASEDRDFYKHPGISVTGLARAALGCLRYAVRLELKCTAGGGSTITQQLAKLMFLYQERTFWRKAKELVLAIKLENHYDKEEILRIYLNRVALGPRIYGVEQAARIYFHKHARELNLYESALIVGAITRPSVNSFAVSRERAYRHGEKVLEAMIAAGYLTVEQKFRAIGGGYKRGTTPWVRIYHGGFWHWIKGNVMRRLGNNNGMFVVITTLNSEMQVYAERQLNRAVRDSAGYGVEQGALLAMAPDGAVYAMVGGVRDKARGWNRVTQAERQPGSIIKPLIYLAALESGWREDQPVEDAPMRCDGWRPSNHDGKYLGPLSLTEALAKSRNTTAVRLSMWAGREKLNQLFRRFGLAIQISDACKEALGSTEMSLLDATMTYSVFANGGYAVAPYGVSGIRNEQGRFIYQHAASSGRRIVDPVFVRSIDAMLRAAVVSGTGRNALLKNFRVAGKTGTTPRNRDAWFIGYSNSLVTGIWMGNDRPSPMPGISGSTLPAQVFRRFMRTAHRNFSFIN